MHGPGGARCEMRERRKEGRRADEGSRGIPGPPKGFECLATVYKCSRCLLGALRPRRPDGRSDTRLPPPRRLARGHVEADEQAVHQSLAFAPQRSLPTTPFPPVFSLSHGSQSASVGVRAGTWSPRAFKFTYRILFSRASHKHTIFHFLFFIYWSNYTHIQNHANQKSIKKSSTRLKRRFLSCTHLRFKILKSRVYVNFFLSCSHFFTRVGNLFNHHGTTSH